MFKKIRYRLLLSNLFVFAIVLTGFTIAVRIAVVHNLKRQVINQLTALGQGIAASAEFEHRTLKFDNDFSVAQLIEHDRALQWFDARGRFLQQQGEAIIAKPFNREERIQVQTGKTPIQAVILPILDSDKGQLMGYLRVSQSLRGFQETVHELDLGLGIGVWVALVLSGLGGLWLNQQAMQPIEENLERLKQFTADASHELRNPLMAIKSNAAVALKYDEGMRSGDREKLSAIVSATDQMSQLTADLLLLAKSDRISEIEQATVNLNVLLQDLVEWFQPQAITKSLKLTLELEPNLVIWGDQTQLQRLFGNLLQNALQYTPSGGKINISSCRLGREIQIAIADNGVGIAPDQLDKIFDRFWRADRSRSYAEGGSGLGLAIVQSIIHQHQAKIAVSSQLGTGSCFLVSFSSQKIKYSHNIAKFSYKDNL